MGNKIKDLSIIIVTWNTSKITQKCIETINHFLGDIPIILVDNASSDDTVQMASNFKNVEIVKNDKNLGFSKANNVGLKLVNTKYVVFMNSDMEFIDNSFHKMFSYFTSEKNIGIIGPKFLFPNLTEQVSVFPKQNISNAFSEFWLGIKNKYQPYIPITKDPIQVWSISGGFILTSTNFFRKIGGWNEKYFFYFEDMDLSRLVNKIGKKVMYFPECKIIHRHGASGKHLLPAKDQWKRLIPGSIKYHGIVEHYLINFVIWSGQKFRKLLNSGN